MFLTVSGVITVDAFAQSEASRQKVWAVLTDVPGWTSWSGCRQAVVESGRQATQVRRFRVPPLPGLPWLQVTSREQTTIYEPPRHWAYVMLSGPPGITDFTADVTLNAMMEGGTAICWHVACRPSITGTGPALRWTLDRLYRATAVGLARAAQHR
jgi:hypothetical protein